MLLWGSAHNKRQQQQPPVATDSPGRSQSSYSIKICKGRYLFSAASLKVSAGEKCKILPTSSISLVPGMWQLVPVSCTFRCCKTLVSGHVRHWQCAVCTWRDLALWFSFSAVTWVSSAYKRELFSLGFLLNMQKSAPPHVSLVDWQSDKFYFTSTSAFVAQGNKEAGYLKECKAVLRNT